MSLLFYLLKKWYTSQSSGGGIQDPLVPQLNKEVA